MYNIMLILPMVFVAGFVVFLKSERRLISSIALAIVLLTALFWIILEELPRIDAYDSFYKISENNKAPMALLHDDKELTVAYLNQSARKFYNMGEEYYVNEIRNNTLTVKSLILSRWQKNRSFAEFKKAVLDLQKGQGASVASLNTLRDGSFGSLKKEYLDKITDNEFEKIRETVDKLKCHNEEPIITLPPRLIADDEINGKKGFEITQLTAVPIKHHSVLNWLGTILMREDKKQYAGYLLTVMTLDLSECDPDTKERIRERLSLTSDFTPKSSEGVINSITGNLHQ